MGFVLLIPNQFYLSKLVTGVNDWNSAKNVDSATRNEISSFLVRDSFLCLCGIAVKKNDVIVSLLCKDTDNIVASISHVIIISIH